MSQDVCTVREIDGVTVVKITERKLFQKAVAVFQDRMVSLLDQDRLWFVIDLSGVDIVNSSGLGVLILVRDRLTKRSGDVILSGLRPFMKELFERMRLDLLFRIADTEEEALVMLGGDKKIPAL